MRWKIILVNGGIVAVLTLITFFLLRSSLATVVADPKVQKAELVRAIHAADARLTLDSLLAERWIARAAATDNVKAVFAAGTASARSESATSAANQLRAAASEEFAPVTPTLVLFVDAQGVGVGRNGSELMRGDKIAEIYPSLASSLKSGNTQSDLWVTPERDEQLLASYAPVRATDGKLLGALIIGSPLNDGRMTRTSDVTSGHSLALVVGDGAHPIAVGGKRLKGFDSSAVEATLKEARRGRVSHVSKAVGGYFFAAASVKGFSGVGALVVGAVPASKVESVDALLWPIFPVGLLGIFLVLAGGVMLGNYISKPISEIEEGLLLVMNGQQDLRFDLEHDELGGLTSRVNGLLNSILGVEEEEGESSRDSE